MTSRATIAVIHIAKVRLGLDDDGYRDLLERVTGRRSAKDLSESQAQAVIEEMRRYGFKDRNQRGGTNAAMLNKLMALWWNLYHLGAADKPSDERMLAFLHRQIGHPAGAPSALRFATGQQIGRAIEGVKQWLTRIGLDPRSWEEPDDVNRALVALLWRRLEEAGALKFKDRGHADNALQAWLERHFAADGAVSLHTLEGVKALKAARRLALWYRREAKLSAEGQIADRAGDQG